MKSANAAQPGGMFSGADFRNAGGGRAALPGTGWLSRAPVPTPTKPPVPPPQPTQAAQPSAQPQQQQAGGALGGFNPASPQFFGMMAGAMKPVTQAVLGYGGLPALAGIYGMVSGNKDWTHAMQKDIPQQPSQRVPNMQDPIRPTPGTGVASRFPLPVKTADNRLVMPPIKKNTQPNGWRFPW